MSDQPALDAAIAAAQQSLVYALTKLRDVTEKPTQQWELREWTGKVWCAHVNEICKDALAKVK